MLVNLDIKGKRVIGNGAAVGFDGSEDLEFGIGVDSDDLEEEDQKGGGGGGGRPERKRTGWSKRRWPRRATGLDNRELELEERELIWSQREYDNRLRLEREFEEERRKRMTIKQMHASRSFPESNANSWGHCSASLPVFGSANDGLGALPPQVLQNLRHPGELDDNGKPDANSPSEFL